MKTFKSVERARAYAKKIGGYVANHQPGYTNKRIGHLKVIRKKK